ncbi:histidine phosphatase family protein [Glaciimonas sp. PAMC28666]|uniref:histidine phosphatase family protein n=1 Tax=Glaciimonas sp. PAMC28666 TaxID=2807626 RepID=UPI0019632A9D|nr:histidine phosphatase family protein [Glaciimonas sp. PAMC28666]QRX82770.1 histidine phosphatase family protein [Glaciimonas sp. PAMC28666]
MQLHLVRHPKPTISGNAFDICYGRSDLPVSAHENARVQNRLIETLLKPALLFSSPLRRCAGLAGGLANEPGWPVPILDSRLLELDFGSWEMQSWQSISRDEIDAWAAAMIDYQPGGGESVMQMAARVQAFYLDLLRLRVVPPHHHNPDDVVVICHAGTIRLLLACHALTTVSAEAGSSVYVAKIAGIADIADIADIAHRAASEPHRIGYGEVVSLSL